jgi:type I restriction-modification system DNA methylase subunit
MTDRLFIQQRSLLENYFRKYGIEGEDAFYTLAYYYVEHFAAIVKKAPERIVQRGQTKLERLTKDRRLQALLEEIVGADTHGDNLPLWYQHFLGRRFREGSGKFFTPRPVAAAMAALLPRRKDAVVMDPTCGGGTFLMEASKRWGGLSCQLVGNDIEPSLIDLAQIVLDLGSPENHKKSFSISNIYEPDAQFETWYGKVHYILANPPFSLQIESIDTESKLFALGYRNSDALFLDICYSLLRPSGRLICLLPHSIIANAEFQKLRFAVEEVWNLRGVISLPEGVFYIAAGTTTRADIVILEKMKGHVPKPSKAIFAYMPSVGVPLNGRFNEDGEVNYLERMMNDSDVKASLEVE